MEMQTTAVRRTTLDPIALARKAGATTNGVKLLRHSRLAVCARAQEINAGERLPNCARLIVEDIHAWEEWRAPNWVPFQPELRTKK